MQRIAATKAVGCVTSKKAVNISTQGRNVVGVKYVVENMGHKRLFSLRSGYIRTTNFVSIKNLAAELPVG
ncbi:MAG: hypothetical protein ABIR33_15365 [Pyrinomonadaceae bacterium]